MDRGLRDRLERLVERQAGRGRSSLIAGVSAGGDRAYFGFGPQRALPNRLSLFEIGSITKVFTGTLLAEMHLRGEVNLEDPLSKYLPAVELPSWRGRAPSLDFKLT
ncbi:MAG: serine hydrolase [Actinomycetota bacterium]|nr:serine hydrolase [Actinomycetota bacterium]